MRERILVVDGNPDIVMALKTRLEESRYQVIVAFDGQTALLKAKEQKPQMIILELLLPVVNGFEVCYQLKHDPELCNIPILILTVRMKLVDRKIAQQYGVDSYIPKPFCSQMLMGEVFRLLSRPIYPESSASCELRKSI